MNVAESKLKRLFTHDWEAKLICLVLAGLLSWVVNDQIRRSEPPPSPTVRLEMPPGYPYEVMQMPEGWPMSTPKQEKKPSNSEQKAQQALPESSLSLPVKPGNPR